MPKALSLKKGPKTNNQKAITHFFKSNHGSLEQEPKSRSGIEESGGKRKSDVLTQNDNSEKKSFQVVNGVNPNELSPNKMHLSPKKRKVIEELPGDKHIYCKTTGILNKNRSPLSNVNGISSKMDDTRDQSCNGFNLLTPKKHGTATKTQTSPKTFQSTPQKVQVTPTKDQNTVLKGHVTPRKSQPTRKDIKSSPAKISPVKKNSSPIKENLLDLPVDFDDDDDLFGDDWEEQIVEKMAEDLDLSVMQRCEVTSVANHVNSIELKLKNADNQRGTCYIEGVWLHTPLTPGETISIFAPLDPHGRHTVSNTAGLLVLRPDHLVSTTSVVAGVFCRRKAVLQERFKGVDSASEVMTIGILVHELVQKALIDRISDTSKLRLETDNILHRSTLMLYDAGLSLNAAKMAMDKYIQPLASFMDIYVLGKVMPGNAPKDRWPGVIEEVVDIEENVCCPRLGLKGKIDATVQVTIHDRKGLRRRHTVPLELKTGMASASAEHRGQLLLYCMMTADESEEGTGPALLLYLKEKADLREVSAGRAEQRDLVLLRNELVQHLTRGPADIDAESTPDIEDIGRLLSQKLPEPIHFENACRKCAYLTLCSLHLWHSGEPPVSPDHPLSKLRDSALGHLTREHIDYFLHWSALLRIEEAMQVKTAPLHTLWTQSPETRAKRGTCAANLTLKSVEPCGNRFLHVFQRSSEDRGIQVGKQLRGPSEGEFSIVSAGKRPWLAAGTVSAVRGKEITILLERDLSRRQSASTQYHADTYESYASAVQNLTNLSALMEDSDRAVRLRELVISKSAASFDDKLPRSVGRLGVKMMKSLNIEQQRAVLKAIAANNYVLLQGLPGTGKTQTVSVLIQMLVALKQRVLVTAHTHSAVDTVLTRLPSSLKILRLGPSSRVSANLQDRCEGTLTGNCTDPEQLSRIYDSMEVVGVTCLGAAHAQLARTTFDVCVVDEATQVLQSTVLRPLLSANKFVLVGDPEQLPPVVRSRAARRLGMEESLFHRLNRPESTVTLRLQYRMNERLTRLANTVAYAQRLKCANQGVSDATIAVDVQKLQACIPSDSWLYKICSPEQELAALFVDMGTGLQPGSGKTLSNKNEGCVVLAIIDALVKCGVKPSDIGVIAPYREQVTLLRGTVAGATDVSTVDQFQGRDKSVVLYTCARSDMNDSVVKEGEVLNDTRRLAVSVTRAKHKFVLIGHSTALKRYDSLQKLIDACHTVYIQPYIQSIVDEFRDRFQL